MDVLSAVTLASKGLGLAKSLFARSQQPQASKTPFTLENTPGQYLVNQRDADGDGLLSLSELGIQEALFDQIDRDGDGLVSITELNDAAARYREAVQLQQGLAKYMTLHDANLDDQITVVESGLEDSAFDGFDLSDDGVLARDEVARGLRHGLDVRS